MPESHPLIEQLAAEHAEHLRWLRARTRGRLAPSDAEDILQAAYANALRSLRGPGSTRPPHFATPDKATAWFRAIASNLAVDEDRRRRGRSGSRRDSEPPRPTPIGELPPVDAGVDVEGEVLRAVERESHQPIVVRAIAALAPEHRQVLQLRYGQDLEPAAIMLLENITRRQWDGRHNRALKAFARALAQVQLGSECRRTRRLLRHSPAALLRPAAAAAATRAHVETCLACGAFARSAQFALTWLPLPIAIEPWRFEWLEHFITRPGGASPQTPTAHPESAIPAHGAGATKLAVSIGLTALAVGGVLALERTGRAELDIPTRWLPIAQPAQRGPSAGWADHATDRQALERSARALGEARARVARR